MKPALGREPVRSKAAEFPELRDHVRLVGIPGFERRLSPIDIATDRRVIECRLKTSQPAIQLGRNANAFAEQTRQMLPRNASQVRKGLHTDVPAILKSEREQVRHVNQGVRHPAESHALKQERFEAVDSLFFTQFTD